MDRFGRRPVLAAGFLAAAAGCALTALATHTSSVLLLLAGFVLIGAGMATVAPDPRRRGRHVRRRRGGRAGISYVLSGAVVGAVLGPAVFSPMFAHRKLDADALTVPWLAAAGIALVALALVMLVRPDPRAIGQLLSDRDGTLPPAPAAPLRRDHPPAGRDPRRCWPAWPASA